MAVSRNYLYDPEDQITSEFARSFGHGARLRILRNLKDSDPLCVQVIAEQHPLCDGTLSQHLKILRNVQLVDWYERFPYTFYKLNEKNMKIAAEHMEKFLNFFK